MKGDSKDQIRNVLERTCCCLNGPLSGALVIFLGCPCTKGMSHCGCAGDVFLRINPFRTITSINSGLELPEREGLTRYLNSKDHLGHPFCELLLENNDHKCYEV